MGGYERSGAGARNGSDSSRLEYSIAGVLSSMRMTLLRLLLVGLLLFSLVLACDRSTDEELGVVQPDGLQGAVVFVLDTVRPDHLSLSQSVRSTSPNLKSLAREGVSFEQVVSYAPWTLPSMIATLSGGSIRRGFERRMTHSVVESIRDAGYSTAAITEGGFVAKRFGLDLGFDSFEEEQGPVQLLSPGQARNPNPSGGIENTFRKAKAWISEHRDERFFLMIHTYEPHTPYTRTHFAQGLDRGSLDEIFRIEDLRRVRSGELPVGETERAYLAALYDGGIRVSDGYIEKFLSHLAELGLRDQTLIVVTSDHGEEFGEHYATRAGDHGHALYDDQLLVPLIFHNPLESYPVDRVGVQVRTMDIFPTIAELLEAPHESDRGGISLVPLLRGESDEGRIAYGGMVDSGPERQFIRYLGYKYIEVVGPDRKMPPLSPAPPPVQLFDLSADPRERTNLAGERPELVGDFHDMLRSLSMEGQAEAFDLPNDLDEKARARLRSLGYLD